MNTNREQQLLNIIRQLRDYIANSDIPVEDSDRLYQEHLALADEVLNSCDSDEEEEEEEHPAHPAYYCDGGCGKKVGNGFDHDCKRICDDCEEDE